MIDFSDLTAMKDAHALRLVLCAEALVIRERWDINTGFDPTALIAALKAQLAVVNPEKSVERKNNIARLTASLSRLARAAWLFGAVTLRKETADDEWSDLTPVFQAQADLQRKLDPQESAQEARKAIMAAIALAATVRSDDPYKDELKRIAQAVRGPAISKTIDNDTGDTPHD